MVTIGARGQVMVPAELRRALGWRAGDYVTFTVEDGALIACKTSEGLRAAHMSIPLEKPHGDAELDEIITEEVAEQFMHESRTRYSDSGPGDATEG